MIYVIGSHGSGIVKIGYAANPHERLRTLQTGNPALLVVLWSHEGDEALEGHLHATFAEHRVRGEWFDLGHAPDPVEAVRVAVNSSGHDLLPRPRREIGSRRRNAVTLREGETAGTVDVWWFTRELDCHFPGGVFTAREAAEKLEMSLEEINLYIDRAVSRGHLIRRRMSAVTGEALYSPPADPYYYPGEIG
ncbi:GIY-YIG nuclease family protein [Streptomyces roseoviridis]|uniref:GIY-YIG nuclease family protein n=1 Tax=Streptomyces roseoviridis TaxID=67361 RepID=A0ABV5R172_9ACTN